MDLPLTFQALGASRPTAQRCLVEPARHQLVELDLAYGTTGRPLHRYRLRAAGSAAVRRGR